jgi:two-component system, NtrC family, nitrogen regulation response regulator NtrX
VNGHALIADDQPEVRSWIASLLRAQGLDPLEVADAGSALAALDQGSPAISLLVLDLDFGAGRLSGMEALRTLRAAGHETPVLILTGKGSVRDAVEALQLGATDFLEKDAHVPDTLAASLRRIERYGRVLAENARLRGQLDKGRALVGHSRAMREVLEQIRRLASVPRPVLVLGERGTGKELVARALHQQSPRSAKPFVTVNCAAIAEGLLECELFGQEENAFDGAPFKEGRFDLAHEGTLFLDEIGNMGSEFQRKVLRVIEYQSFERVQGTRTITVDVRIVAATNADLHSAIDDGRFRADLYDRIAFDVVRIPPLRERREDIAFLAEHFAERFHAEVAGVVPLRFSPDAIEAMQRYAWPGNVRELRNFVERLATRLDDPAVDAETVHALLPETDRVPGTQCTPAVNETGTFEERVARFERDQLTRALGAAGGNRKRAAEALGLSYDQIRRLLAKHDL